MTSIQIIQKNSKYVYDYLIYDQIFDIVRNILSINAINQQLVLAVSCTISGINIYEIILQNINQSGR